MQNRSLPVVIASLEAHGLFLLRAAAKRLASVTLLLFFIASGCGKGPYHIVRIESELLKNNYLYLLIFREDGVNTASRLQEGGYELKQRQRLVLARVFLGSASNKFEVLAACDQPQKYFDSEAGFMLVSSNAVLAETRGGGIDLIQFGADGNSDTPTEFAAGRRFYNFDHSVIFSMPGPRAPGAGQTWAIATFSLSNKTESVSGISGLITNANLPGRFSVAPDCSAAMVQMQDGDPTNFLVCSRMDGYKQQRVVISIPRYATLAGMFDYTNKMFMVMSYFENLTNINNLIPGLLVCDERGVEVASTRMGNTFFFDNDQKRIICVPDGENDRIDSIPEMDLKIWSPFTGVTQIVRADTTAIRQAFLKQ